MSWQQKRLSVAALNARGCGYTHFSCSADVLWKYIFPTTHLVLREVMRILFPQEAAVLWAVPGHRCLSLLEDRGCICRWTKSNAAGGGSQCQKHSIKGLKKNTCIVPAATVSPSSVNTLNKAVHLVTAPVFPLWRLLHQPSFICSMWAYDCSWSAMIMIFFIK